MTTKEAFTAEEWKSLVMAGTWIGHAIIISDTPRRYRKELRELRKAFESAARNYPGNQLIGAVLPEAKTAALADIDAKAMYESKDENTKRLLAGIQEASMALKKAEKKEATEFKRWLLNIGELTALAVRDEEYASIGMPGDEISRLERRLLREIAKILVLIPYTVDIEPLKK